MHGMREMSSLVACPYLIFRHEFWPVYFIANELDACLELGNEFGASRSIAREKGDETENAQGL